MLCRWELYLGDPSMAKDREERWERIMRELKRVPLEDQDTGGFCTITK
jgi:hypothetical protein